MGLIFILWLFIFSQEKSALKTRTQNLEKALVFNDVEVSQLKENAKLWVLKIKKATIFKEKEEIILEDNAGFIFDGRQPIFKITSPLAKIDQKKNQLTFKAPKIEKVPKAKETIIDKIFLEELDWQPDKNLFEGFKGIWLTGPRFELRAGHFQADNQLTKIVLKDKPVIHYRPANSSSLLNLAVRQLEVDQKSGKISGRDEVRLSWNKLAAFGEEFSYTLKTGIFSLFKKVRIVYNNLNLAGDKIFFNPENDEVEVVGSPVIVQKNGEILKSARINLSLKKEELNLKKLGELEINLESIKK